MLVLLDNSDKPIKMTLIKYILYSMNETLPYINNVEERDKARASDITLYTENNKILKMANEALKKLISMQKAEILKLKAEHQKEIQLLNEHRLSEIHMKNLEKQHLEEIKQLKEWHSQDRKTMISHHIQISKQYQDELDRAELYPIQHAAKHLGNAIAELSPISYDAEEANKERTAESLAKMHGKYSNLVVNAIGLKTPKTNVSNRNGLQRIHDANYPPQQPQHPHSEWNWWGHI